MHCLSIFCAFVTVSAFFQQYGQCRAINNVALAEVNEVCVSGGSMEEKGKWTVGDKENKEMGKKGEKGER